MLLLPGCVDPIEFEQEDQQEHLVVEATFSNLDSSYVRLSYSQPYRYPFNKFEENATVYITSEAGEYIPFYHTQSGLYKPEAEARAQIGHTYQLHLQIGPNSYASKQVKVLEPVPIDSVYTEFAEVEVGIWGAREKALMPGYKFFVDYTDPGGLINFYRWSVTSVIEVYTQPWDYIDYSCIGCPRPAPKDCCAHCWIYERAQLYKVQNDRLSDGRKTIHQELHFVPFERDLQAKNKITIYQHAISEEAYNFFKVVEQQQQRTGTVFDPPPSQLKGNIYNVENEDEQVIGFFDASAVSKKEIIINRKNIKEMNVGEYVYPDDCREIRNATTRKPEGW
ncbi:DUF4249 domain-containing protein [Pontibacter ummariensis]|nr:DUF4249 domain-containing protein [Pontibacter ummariensis]